MLPDSKSRCITRAQANGLTVGGGDVDPVPTNVPEDRSVGSKMISPYHTHDYQPNAWCGPHCGLWNTHQGVEKRRAS